MKNRKWIYRIGVIILMSAISQGNDVGIIGTILWNIGGLFFYLFFLEYTILSMCANQENEHWLLVAHKFYMDKKPDIPYVKFMWHSFILMLTETYED